MPLDRVGDETGRPVVLHPVETFEQRLEVVTGQVRHQPVQGVIVVLVEELGNTRYLAEVARELVTPGLAASIGKRRVDRVGTRVDPFTQLTATRLHERGLEKLAVLEHDHLPFDRTEQVLEALRKAVDHHGIETLAVVIDDPPDVSDIVFPRLEQRLEHIPFVELRISGQRNHPPGRTDVRHPFQPKIVLNQSRERGHRDAETDPVEKSTSAASLVREGYAWAPSRARIRIRRSRV